MAKDDLTAEQQAVAAVQEHSGETYPPLLCWYCRKPTTGDGDSRACYDCACTWSQASITKALFTPAVYAPDAERDS